jgi:aspartyl-tRNA(Asn)/glutamyl-tRNA(Gln) amidotransferase subunit A
VSQQWHEGGDGRPDGASSLAQQCAEIAAGTRSAADHVRAAFEGIAARDGRAGLNAFVALDEGAALETAGATPAGPLAGATVAVKDNLCTLRMPTTCGSRLLEGYVAPFEATAVRALRDAGAIVLGKTNMDEFGMGSSTENSAWGVTRNPFDPARVAGGSSGGSAVAVAAGFTDIALGSETGGSVRQPAAFCGVVGIKPSYGRVSRYGLVAYASSLDCVGVFGRSVADAALTLETIAGHDPRDATSAQLPVPALARAAAHGSAPASARGLVIGVPHEYFPPQLEPETAARCADALDRLRAAGATVRPVSLPHTRYAIPTYYVIATAEASSNLARYDAVRYGTRGTDGKVYEGARAHFGTEVKRRIVLGTFVLSAGYHDAYYGRAQRVRRLIARDFAAVFASGVDVLFTPTTPAPAFAIGEKTDDPYAMYLSDVFTVTANLAALPALSLPIGSAHGLPVGGQLIADRWAEQKLVTAAAALERALVS